MSDWTIKDSVEMMANADFETTQSLSAAMGLLRCIHGCEFPCAQCVANRRWNEMATGKVLTEREFETRYTQEPA